jgi:hypothetical protein
MAKPSQGETQDSPNSYAHSSDFNPLRYTPIASKKLPKWWFPDVYPQYAPSYHSPTEKSSSPEHQNPETRVPLQDDLYVLVLLMPCG